MVERPYKGHHLVVGVSSLTLTAEEKIFLRRVQPSGVILFSRNIQELDQVQALIFAIRDQVSPLCTVWIDQEGGRVQRLRQPFTSFPSPWYLAQKARLTLEAGDKTGSEQATVLARLAGQVCGMELASLGIGVNCAPVLDIREAGADPVIGERAFGATPEEVVQRAGAWLEGLQQHGVMAIGKHFPGHGAARADSHKSLPLVSKSRAAWEQWELQPFKRLMTRLPALMTAHLVADGLDGAMPATCSSSILQGILRQEWGYTGLIVSDALEMQALSGSLEERSYRSLMAGCDLVLCCTGRVEDNEATLLGAMRASETLTTVQRQQWETRVEQLLRPYALIPGDWKELLRRPDYLQSRRLVEAIAEDVRDEDPTEHSIAHTYFHSF